jgi:phenylacetate-CoA ligase
MSAREQWRDLVVASMERPPTPLGEFYAPKLETLTRDQLEALQGKKLVAAFRLLREASAFYRHKFDAAGLGEDSIQSVVDLAKIPLTHPSEWMADQERFPPFGRFSTISDEDWTTRGWMLFTTSGTKAAFPRAFRHTTFDRDQWTWHGARALHAMGVQHGDIALNAFGYGTSVACWGLHHALNELGVPVIPGGGASTDRRAELIHLFRPTVLLTTPSHALGLGQAMLAVGHDPRASSVRKLVLAGEPGASVPSTRLRLRDLWDAEVHDDFGCTEVAMSPLGYTCRTSATSAEAAPHLMEDQYLVEVLDPTTWEPVAEGDLGVLVVSNLFSEAQPILRYVMGDWLRITRERCPCGRTHARAPGGLQGRFDDVVKVKGLKFYPAVFEDVVRSVKGVLDEFRVVIESKGDLDRVKVTVEGTSEELAPVVRSRIAASLGIDVSVEVVAPGTYERKQGKTVRFSDSRPKKG